MNEGARLLVLACMQVSNTSLCTVMDECRGGDLECLLQRRGALPEDEARCILRQVVPGS